MDEQQYLVDEAFKALARTTEGQAFLWWLFEITKFPSCAYTGHALSTAFNEGEFNVGAQIYERLINVAPDGYLGMMQAHFSQSQTQGEVENVEE